MNNIMELFIRDSKNHIYQLINFLMQFKKDSGEKLHIENAFRAAHSIKTEAAYLELDNITNLSHEIENELEILLTQKVDFSKEKYDSLIEKTELLQEIIEIAAKEEVSPSAVSTSLPDDIVEVDETITEEEEFSESENIHENSHENIHENEQVFDDFQLHLLFEAMKRGEKFYRITCDIFPDTIMKFARLYLIINNLELHTNLIKTVPAIDVTRLNAPRDIDNNEAVLLDPDLEKNTRIRCYITTNKNYDQIYDILNIDEIKNIQIINIPYESYFSNKVYQESLDNIMPVMRTIAVKTDLIDSLLTSIHKMRMEVNIKYDDLKNKNSSVLEQNLETMADSIRQLRMSALSDEFGLMPSHINKIAFTKGKEVDILFEDNNIEIDRSVFEYIYDPIIHIFKNAIDHGIETAEERKNKGKNPKGKIVCKTYLINNSLTIEISDDGKGVDFDKIAEKSGFSVAQLKHPDKLLSVISSPGFSTKENADEHSGRGFGMNLVKEKLAQIRSVGHGASLEIDSKEDEGTVVIIRLSDNYVAKNILYLLLNKEIIVVPADAVEKKVESLNNISKTDSNQIMYEDIPVYTKDGILFSNSVNDFKNLKGVIINKNNKKALILCEKILFKESIPADKFYLMMSQVPYLFIIKILGIDNEYYYLDSSIMDSSKPNI